MLHTLIPGQEFQGQGCQGLPRGMYVQSCVMCAYAPQIRSISPHITATLCPLPPYDVLFICMGIFNLNLRFAFQRFFEDILHITYYIV